ncbi:hypothetical protein ACSLBF_03770 [Pseudoalteromonas sp. T1lg65]|uniref:hypothetical protein n=1 Tax=Pseudoalteromonas sp. T1lg65 TaxID=2077101 RepID=UPI003F7A80E2
MYQAVDISSAPITKQNCHSEVVSSGLLNPRGFIFNDEGELLLVEAGAGEMTPPFTGQLTKRNREDGVVLDTLLCGVRALNMQQRMLRDEIMGLADITFSDKAGSYMVSLTDYINGSKIIEVSQQGATPAFETQGNLNSICYHPKNQAWYCIKPDTNEVIEFVRNQPERVVCTLPRLASGQEAVPVNVIYHAKTGELLISLFSGELGRGEDYRGIDFMPCEGAIVSVAVSSGKVSFVVTGLTLPTALGIDGDKIFVTELCSDCLEPLPADHIPKHPLHGGFRRFSGRLLSIDLTTKVVSELIVGLDTPSNLVVHQDTVFITEGMGVPGRPIQTPIGESMVSGLLRKVTL